MCFSATASFIAGGTLSAAGVFTLTQAKKKAELPFASIPLLFGVQQATEGVVWLSFGTPLLNTVATYVYSIFSHVFWPIFAPLAILLIEPDPARRKILRVFALLGFMVGSYFSYFLIVAPVTAQIVGRSIAYHSPHVYPILTMTFYLVAICGSFLFSTHKVVKLFGLMLLASFFVSVWFFSATFFSVWCFFAALLSVLVYWHFRKHAHLRPKS